MINGLEIILASASPRRHELLSLAGIEHRVMTAPADEDSVSFEKGKPEEYVIEISKIKNSAVLREKEPQDAIIVSADTAVYLPSAEEIMGKPGDREDAVRMLSSLSGKAHLVVTGVTIYNTKTGEEKSFAESTDVYFRELSTAEIEKYVDTARPFDKAGAYGIQEEAAVFVSKIHGDYFNVVGLPLCRLYTEIMSMV